MSFSVGPVIQTMIQYNGADVARIHHALKVYAFAKSIGELEGLDGAQMEVLETAAVLHDIGIHNSEAKYGSAAGKYQEIEGPSVAQALLDQLGTSQDVINRVCFLVGHHHTYTGIDGLDYQILIEADFLVNLYEDGLGKPQAQTVLEKYFKTKTGRGYLSSIFLSDADKG